MPVPNGGGDRDLITAVEAWGKDTDRAGRPFNLAFQLQVPSLDPPVAFVIGVAARPNNIKAACSLINVW